MVLPPLMKFDLMSPPEPPAGDRERLDEIRSRGEEALRVASESSVRECFSVEASRLTKQLLPPLMKVDLGGMERLLTLREQLVLAALTGAAAHVKEESPSIHPGGDRLNPEIMQTEASSIARCAVAVADAALEALASPDPQAIQPRPLPAPTPIPSAGHDR